MQYAPDSEIFQEEQGGRSAADYLILIKKGWLWLAVGAALFGSAAFLYAVLTPDSYEAASQIMVEKVEKQDNISKSQELVMPSWSVEDDYFGTQVIFLTSNKILGEAAIEAALPEGARVMAATSGGSKPTFGRGTADGPVYRVQAKRLIKSRLITLKVSGPDPAVCAKLANAISAIYLRENAMQNLFISKQMYKWLEDGDQGIEPMDPAQRSELADSMQTVVNDPELVKFRSDKETILNQLRELSLRYRPKHPRIKELSHSLQELNKNITARREVLIANLKNSLAGSLNVTNVRILDPAIEPLGPSGPNRPGIILQGILGGAAAGALIVILLELLNQKVRTEKDLPTLASTPYLGAIPKIGSLSRLKGADPLKSSVYVDILNNDLELRDAVVGIRTHILFSTTYEKTKRVMFANSTAEEGKSTVATLIALSLASMGRKILLIEADLRNPGIARSMGLGSSKGLSDFLNGESEFGSIVQTVSGATLDVIAGGTPTNQSSALLASPRFDKLLDDLSARYDRIILIAPPILTGPDSLIIAKNISCGILVCASGITDIEAVRESEQKFMVMKRPLVGVVINKLDHKNSVYRQAESGTKIFGDQHISLQPFRGSSPALKTSAQSATDTTPKSIKQN